MGSVGNEVAFTAPTNLYASFISPHPRALAVVMYGILPAEVYTVNTSSLMSTLCSLGT
jgi:hypothetical protein